MSIPFNLDAQIKHAEWLHNQRALAKLNKMLNKMTEKTLIQIPLIFLVGEGKAPAKRNLTNLKKRK